MWISCDISKGQTLTYQYLRCPEIIWRLVYPIPIFFRKHNKFPSMRQRLCTLSAYSTGVQNVPLGVGQTDPGTCLARVSVDLGNVRVGVVSHVTARCLQRPLILLSRANKLKSKSKSIRQGQHTASYIRAHQRRSENITGELWGVAQILPNNY